MRRIKQLGVNYVSQRRAADSVDRKPDLRERIDEVQIRRHHTV